MLKKVYFFCLFLFSFCFLFAVGKKDENILSELERKYPSEEYFFAVGTGLSRQVAESSAKFSIFSGNIPSNCGNFIFFIGKFQDFVLYYSGNIGKEPLYERKRETEYSGRNCVGGRDE